MMSGYPLHGLWSQQGESMRGLPQGVSAYDAMRMEHEHLFPPVHRRPSPPVVSIIFMNYYQLETVLIFF